MKNLSFEELLKEVGKVDIEKVKKENGEKMERISKEVNNDIDKLIESVDEADTMVFEYYRDLINKSETTFDEIIQPLTDTGIIELIRTIAKVYVKNIYAGEFKATGKELAQVRDMWLFVHITNAHKHNEELFLEGCLFSIVASAREMGGEQ